MTSVFVAAVPLWTAFFDALVPGGKTVLTWRLGVGLALGFLGSALLAGVTTHELLTADLRGPIALTLASASWAMGSVYWKRHPTQVSPYAAAAVQMASGRLLTALGLALGDGLASGRPGPGHRHLVGGSIVGYTAYGYAPSMPPPRSWHVRLREPVVAVLLGWLVLHEPVTDAGGDGAHPRGVLWIQLPRGLPGRPGARGVGRA
jgi:drug/metabolite transporter (DMT)-like permease